MRLRSPILPATFLAALLLGAPAAAEDVLVKRALDGDSLLLADDRQVRLIGINAPELGKDGAPDQPLAAAARAVLARHAEGRRIAFTLDAETVDRYGRLLAYGATADGHDLQEVLLREGLAWFVAIAPNLAHLAHYRAAEKAARANRRGIWGLALYRPKPVEQVTGRDAGFRLVVGTVRGVRRSDEVWYFELSPRVYLSVRRADWIHFTGRPMDWIGRRLVARGWLSEYKGSLHMRISHPAMLEDQP